MVELNYRYGLIENEIKLEEPLSNIAQDILKNGKQIIFAIMGVLYRIANSCITIGMLITDTDSIRKTEFVYGTIIGDYHEDDLDTLLKKMVIHIVTILSDGYKSSLRSGESTSVSNYFKTDTKYWDNVLVNFATAYNWLSIGEDLKKESMIFVKKV